MKPLVLNRLALVLAFAGLLVSGVLSIGQFYSISIPCGEDYGCDRVALHWTSHALGIPNAYLGFVAYLILAVVSYWRIASSGPRSLLVVGYVVSAVGTLASLILTYVAISVIHATCIWCLTSTAIMVLILILHALLMQADSAPRSESAFDGILVAGLSLGTLVGLGAMWTLIVHRVQPNVNTTLPLSIYLPADAHTYGDPQAPVTIVEFGDLVCPTCRVEYPMLKSFVDKHPGEVKYVFRHCPLIGAEGHQQAAPTAIMSEIAAEKGKFWPFIDAIYSDKMGEFKDFNPVLGVAQSLGLDPDKALERIRNDKDPAFKRVMRDLRDASQIGVRGTPTFFLIAKGVKGVRTTIVQNVYSDLERPEYAKFFHG